MNMKINSENFRVRAGKKVILKKMPTQVKPCYKSKKQYQEIINEHIRKLSYPEADKTKRKELQSIRKRLAKT
jgi:hypothetical protein